MGADESLDGASFLILIFFLSGAAEAPGEAAVACVGISCPALFLLLYFIHIGRIKYVPTQFEMIDLPKLDLGKARQGKVRTYLLTSSFLNCTTNTLISRGSCSCSWSYLPPPYHPTP